MERNKTIKLNIGETAVGSADVHYYDEHGNKIATLFKDGKDYAVIFHIEIPNYKPIYVPTKMHGAAIIKKVLNENGYTITNSYFP